MLLAHPVPDHIIIGETLPALADLGSVAEGGGVKIGEDAEGDFGRSDRQKVNSEKRLKMVGEEGELGHTTLGQEAAEDKLAMTCWCRAEEGPDVRDNLLILVRQSFDILLELIKLNLVSGSFGSQVGTMSVTESLLSLCSSVVSGRLFRPREGWE